jgi:hypothetical protein
MIPGPTNRPTIHYLGAWCDNNVGRTVEEPEHSLDLEEHPRVQRLGWAVSRIAWGVMAAVVVAALLGLFGGGPLGRRSTNHPSGVVLRYDGFGRYGADSGLLFEIPASAAGGNERSVWVDTDYLQSMKIDHISPEPDMVTQTRDGYRYTFLVSDRVPVLEATFDLTAAEVGRIQGGFSDGEVDDITTFDQFIFP